MLAIFCSNRVQFVISAIAESVDASDLENVVRFVSDFGSSKVDKTQTDAVVVHRSCIPCAGVTMSQNISCEPKICEVQPTARQRQNSKYGQHCYMNCKPKHKISFDQLVNTKLVDSVQCSVMFCKPW